MKEVFSIENMRLSDRAAMRDGIGEIEMVQRAAAAIADYEPWQDPIAIVCGKGNNGADGMALASILAARGLKCTVYVIHGKRNDTCDYYCRHLNERVKLCEMCLGTSLKGYRTVFDCILGIGFHGEPDGLIKAAITAINESGAKVVSVDINSGLNADSGMKKVAVRAQLTLSVGGYKAGHLLNMAMDCYDRLDNLDIGITPVEATYQWLEQADVAALLPKRKHFSNKGDYGYVALVGGSLPYSGAIRLAALAAASMRAGAGVVKVATPIGLCDIIAPQLLESTLFPLAEREGHMAFDAREMDALVGNVKAVAFGMGIGTSPDVEQALSYLLGHYHGRLAVDADGLNVLAKMDRRVLSERQCALVLTPHVKEFARLTGHTVEDIFDNFIPYAQAYARQIGGVVVLKGPTSVVTDGERVALISVGSPGMATAGSGDVLSGVLAATLAYVEDIFDATCLAVYINGRAGAYAAQEMGVTSMVASDTVAQIARVTKQLAGE